MLGDFFAEKKPLLGSWMFCVMAVVLASSLLVSHVLTGPHVQALELKLSLATQIAASPVFHLVAMVIFGATIWFRHVWPARIRRITAAWYILFVGYLLFSILTFGLALIMSIWELGAQP